MENKHTPVMLEEIKSYIPCDKEINVIDATFGGGGYSKLILENFEIGKLIAIDRDPLANFFAKKLLKKYKNFQFVNGCFSKIDSLVHNKKNIIKNKFDIIIFDLGLSSNQLEDSSRGFSFLGDTHLDMGMGQNNKNVKDVINRYSEKDIANIIYKFGEEKKSKKIAKKIILRRKNRYINTTQELVKIINSCYDFKIKKYKIEPATKTFQALRIYVNEELNELSTALTKCINLLNENGKIIIVSFQSLEDRIVKDFFNHNSGKRRRSSRHYPELSDDGPITLKLITKKPIRPSDFEIKNNSRSRSAKLRVAEKIKIN